MDNYSVEMIHDLCKGVLLQLDEENRQALNATIYVVFAQAGGLDRTITFHPLAQNWNSRVTPS